MEISATDDRRRGKVVAADQAPQYIFHFVVSVWTCAIQGFWSNNGVLNKVENVQ